MQYTVATVEGRVISGLLGSESKTSIEVIDAEGKRHAILRDDIDQMAASKKSLMPEGFEKQIPPDGLNDLLAFLTQPGKYSAARPEQGRDHRQYTRHVLKTMTPSPSGSCFPTGLPRSSTASRSCWSTRRVTRFPMSFSSMGRKESFPPLCPIGRASLQIQGKGDPPVERCQRLGLSVR